MCGRGSVGKSDPHSLRSILPVLPEKARVQFPSTNGLCVSLDHHVAVAVVGGEVRVTGEHISEQYGAWTSLKMHHYFQTRHISTDRGVSLLWVCVRTM